MDFFFGVTNLHVWEELKKYTFGTIRIQRKSYKAGKHFKAGLLWSNVPYSCWKSHEFQGLVSLKQLNVTSVKSAMKGVTSVFKCVTSVNYANIVFKCVIVWLNCVTSAYNCVTSA